METVLFVLVPLAVLLVGLVVLGRRYRRRHGWSDDPAQRGLRAESSDARGAVNQNGWMLGGGGSGGG